MYLVYKKEYYPVAHTKFPGLPVAEISDTRKIQYFILFKFYKGKVTMQRVILERPL